MIHAEFTPPRPRLAAPATPIVPGKPKCATQNCCADAAPARSLCAVCEKIIAENRAHADASDARMERYAPLFVFALVMVTFGVVQGFMPRPVSGLVAGFGVVVGLFFACFWARTVRPAARKAVR